MRLIARLLKWVGLLLLLPLLAVWALMAWDTWHLDRDIRQVAASFVRGGSPFVIPLPTNRVAMVSVMTSDANQVCGSFAIKQGVVRSARIDGQIVPLTFDRGIDLSPYAASLQACNQISVTLMATMSFFKASFAMVYDGLRITDIDAPQRWD
jgi:hypothetical protein